MTRSIPWPRIVAEGIAIVVSILLAFGIQAWWEGRQERIREREILQGLQADFEATIRAIDEYRGGRDTILAAARELLSHTGPRRYDLDPARADTLLARVLVGGAFQPVDATLASLLSSDGLGIVSNATLRSLLAEWPRLIAAVDRYQDNNTTQFLGLFMPYLYDRVPVRALDRISSPQVGDIISGFDLNAWDLLADLRFENSLNDVVYYYAGTLDELQAVEEHSQRASELVESELDD